MGGGSETDIAKMLDAHYAGEIDIADYWAVGDTRTESITAIATSGTIGESQSAQDIDLVIIGMNHDDLADGSGKTAVTVQTKNQLGTAGWMNYQKTGISIWSESERRTWCNDNFKSALPTWLQNVIKPVTKLTNRYAISTYESSRSHVTTTDEVFLLSEFEVFGNPYFGSEQGYGSLDPDGDQYEYMKTQANRIKSGPSSYWFTRSSFIAKYASKGFFVVKSDGNELADTNRIIEGIAPGFSI